VIVREFSLVDAAVPRTATFGEAAARLADSDVDAIAVLDDDLRVIGLFTNDDLIRGLFPLYLGELRHTAFIDDQPTELAARLERVLQEPVERHMGEPETVDAQTSASHAAERFLHCPWAALAVVEKGRFVGMLDEVGFAREMLERIRVSG
jgi:CBS domain-containing protein